MHRNLRLVSLKATFFYALTCDCFFKTRLLHQGEKQRFGPLHEYLRSIVFRYPTFRHDKHTVTVHNRIDSMSDLSKRKPTPHQLNSKIFCNHLLISCDETYSNSSDIFEIRPTQNLLDSLIGLEIDRASSLVQN